MTIVTDVNLIVCPMLETLRAPDPVKSLFGNLLSGGSPVIVVINTFLI